MDFLPIFLNVRAQPCLVIGGGEVAARKVELLLKAQANVTLVSPELCKTLAALHRSGKFTHVAETFRAEQIGGQRVVIAATDDEIVNRAVAEAASARNIPVNVVDRPELCTFIMPAIIDRSPVVVAVSSGGASPVLARLLRARLESLVPASYGRLATLVGSFRDKVKARFAPGADRRVFWERGCKERLPSWCTPDGMTRHAQRLKSSLPIHTAASRKVRCIWLAPGREIQIC